MPPKINYKRCVGCRKCYDLCPMDVIIWDDKIDMPVIAYPEECWHCGVCWAECPKRAIELVYPAAFW